MRILRISREDGKKEVVDLETALVKLTGYYICSRQEIHKLLTDGASLITTSFVYKADA